MFSLLQPPALGCSPHPWDAQLPPRPSRGIQKPQPGQGTVQWGICTPPGTLDTLTTPTSREKINNISLAVLGSSLGKPSTGSCRGGSARSPSDAPAARSAQTVPSPRRFKCPRGGTKIGLSLSAGFCKNWERTILHDLRKIPSLLKIFEL